MVYLAFYIYNTTIAIYKPTSPYMANQSPTRSIDSKHLAIFVVATGSTYETRLEGEHAQQK